MDVPLTLSDYITLTVSTVLILIGCFSKEYYWKRFRGEWQDPGKPAPLWFGRLIFISLGLLLLALDLKSLSHH